MSTEQTTAQATPKKSNTLVIALAAAIVVGGAGFGAWKFLPAKGDKKTEGNEEETEKPTKKRAKKKPATKSVLHLDSFVVNLNGADDGGYLRIGIDLGLDAEEVGGEGEAKKKGAGPIPIIRDTVLTVLGKSKSSELLTAEGKEALKKDLLSALDERLPELGITDVFYTEFIVQK